MITNANELNIALEQLAGFADLLKGMRLHAEKHQSRRFPIISTAYIHRIREINAEIRDYLQTRNHKSNFLPQQGRPRRPHKKFIPTLFAVVCV